MYNGYENYATWNVCLWIANDEGLYHIAQNCDNYSMFKEQMKELNSTETPDSVAWNDSGINLEQVAEFWGENFSKILD